MKDFANDSYKTVVLIAEFIFVVSFSTLYAQTQIIQGTACSCRLPIHVLIPTLSSLGIFIGSLVYYLLFPKFEENKERYLSNIKSIIDILDPESKIIKMMIEGKGKVTQSKISSEIGKVKAHRILKELELRGVIEKEQYGKTNVIKFSKKFSDIVF